MDVQSACMFRLPAFPAYLMRLRPFCVDCQRQQPSTFEKILRMLIVFCDLMVSVQARSVRHGCMVKPPMMC